MMGLLVSLVRRKQSTESILENLSKEISSLQTSRNKCSDLERRLASRLVIYSSAIYVTAAVGWYYWGASLSHEWYSRLLYTLPFVLSPLLLVLLRRSLRWFFVRRITRAEDDLKRLENQREEIFRQLMEKETYKRVVELMKKYFPEKLKEGEIRPNAETAEGTPRSNREGAETVKRDVSPSQTQTNLRHRRTRPIGPLANESRTPMPMPVQTPAPELPVAITPQLPRTAHPNPQLIRPILPQNRSTTDRLIDWVLGDGVENRYALICSSCCSHNGMALREEFEHLAFRCAYCGHMNAARKPRGLSNASIEPAPCVQNISAQSTATTTANTSQAQSRQNSQENLADTKDTDENAQTLQQESTEPRTTTSQS